MILNICPIKDAYRGIDRSLDAADLFTKKAKNVYEQLLELYYQSVTYTLNTPPSTSIIKKLITICNEFLKYDIKSEVIVCDTIPIISAFNYKVEYLGIDIIYDGCESVIRECEHGGNKHFKLNRNMLFDIPRDAKKHMDNIIDYNREKCQLFYVYKIIY